MSRKLNQSLNQFRLASRELFNTYFLDHLAEDPTGWEYLEHFGFVEESLFSALVAVPNGLKQVVYGFPQPEIVARVTSQCGAPIMLNREIDSGYWDDPVVSASASAMFTFQSFFDWDQVGVKDHRYARVIVLSWPGKEELTGKHALIETQYVVYERADAAV